LPAAELQVSRPAAIGAALAAPAAPAPAAEAAPAARLTPDAVQKSLSHSVRDGCWHAFMLGSGEAYFSPYAIFIGAGSVVVGLLASLPLLVGALAQLLAVRLLDRGLGRRQLCLAPAILQAFSFPGLLLLPWLFPAQATTLATVCVLAYFALGSFVHPSWNSWMGDLVEPERRGAYFGRRDKLRTLFQLAGVLGAGLALSAARPAGHEFLGFAAIFLAAAIARLLSARELARMQEPPRQPPAREHQFRLLAFLRRLPRNNFGRFTLYVAAVQASTQLAGPFFALYMLRDLKMSYGEFTVASTLCVLAQALTLHNWGKVGDRFGNFTILRVTGILIPFVPLLWLVSPSFSWILVCQVVSGFLWAGFNLSAANFVFDAVSPPKRARCVAYFNLVVNSGFLIGAVAGGCIAPFLPAALSLAGWQLPIVSGLQTLFLLSGLARMLVSIGFLRFIREVRQVERASAFKVVFQVVGLSAIRGLRISIFNGVHKSERRTG
jgi:MFS family permease